MAKRTWDIVKKYPLAIIDSIRGEVEVDFLKTKSNFVRNKVLAKRGSYFYLIAVTASRKIRYQRLAERKRESDPITWKGFLAADKKDFKSGQGKFGRNITACLKNADLLIVNNGTVKQLEKKVEEWLVETLEYNPPKC